MSEVNEHGIDQRVTCPHCGMRFTPREPAFNPELSKAELRKRWLDRYSPNSRNENDAKLTHFLEINGTDAVKVIQQDNETILGFLNKYKTHRKEVDHCAPPTLSKDMRVILGYFKFSRYIPLTGLSRDFTKSQPNEFEDMEALLTHEQVREMIGTQDLIDRKAVICFLAQTGQRVGVLTGLKWNMIVDLPENWGLVNVPDKLLNTLNQNVNKRNREYKFLIHPETMSLLRQIPRRDETDYVWHFRMVNMENEGEKPRDLLWGVERMGDVFGDARGKVLEREAPEPSPAGRRQHEFHTHSLRYYWKDRMQQAGVHEVTLRYLMGKKILDEGTYDRGLFALENLRREYKKAEPYLGGLISPIHVHS